MKRINRHPSAIVLLITGLCLVLIQCKNDNEPPVIKKKPNTVSSEVVDAYLKKNAPTAQKFTVNAGQAISFTSANGYVYNFNPNSFRNASNAVVSGNVDIQVTEYTTTADMIYSGVTTSSGNAPLQSGGMFYIDVSQQGEALKLNGLYNVFIPSDNIDPSMRIFSGVEVENSNGDTIIDWVVNDSSSWTSDTSAGDLGYRASFNILSWCNLDRFYNASSGSQVRLQLPSGFTSQNTKVYMIFDERSVVSLFGDTDKKEFNSGDYILPLNWDIKLLAIAQKDDDLYYGLVHSTIVADHLETLSELTKVSETDLDDIIEGL